MALLRKLHARRVAGECSVRSGRLSDLVARRAKASSGRRRRRRSASACRTFRSRMVPGHTGVQSKEELRRNILGVTLDNVVEEPDRRARREGDRRASPARATSSFSGSFDEVNQLLLRARVCRDGLPIVPPTRERSKRSSRYTDRDPDESPRHPAARQPRGDHLEHRGQRRDGGLPSRIHAGARRAGRGDGRSAVRRRAQRQHAGRRDADHPQRPDHQGARLQLHAGRDARRLPAEHLGRPLLAPVPAQRRGLPAAQDRQGDFRQHLARRARGERGRARKRSAGQPHQRRHGFRGAATTPSRSRATPAATRSRRSPAARPKRCCRTSPTRSCAQ